MPAHQMDLQAYARFLSACAADPRFNSGTLIAAIEKVNPSFWWWDRLTHRLFVIPLTKRGNRRSHARERLVRRAAAAGAGPRGHLQSL